jgi:hypothetical protein
MGASARRWTGLVLVLLGVMGVAIALTAVLSALPRPAAGGTCGPGRGSESALSAFFDPGSIGAGPVVPRANAANYFNRLAFIGECQSAADARMLIGLAVVVLSLGALALGVVLMLRSRRPAAEDHASAEPVTSPYGGAFTTAWVPPSAPAPPEHIPASAVPLTGPPGLPLWGGSP